jgi:C-terminal processing protease CtpA/Prc
MKKIYFILLCFGLLSCDATLTEDQSHDPVYIFEMLWKEVDRHYALFPYQQLDWDSVYSQYRPQIHAESSEQELFDLCSEMLSVLNDPHTNVYSNKGVGGSINYFSRFPINQLDDISAYFSQYKSYNRIMDWGLLQNSNLGYVRIKTFEGAAGDFKNFKNMLEQMPNISGLVIDLRSNRGGLISNASHVLSQLADSKTEVAKYRFRNGSSHTDFSEWMNFSITPSKDKYLGSVAVLTNRQSFSACEWFVMSAKVLPQMQVIGDTTGGGSAIPLLRELPNGWLLRVSNTQMQPAFGEDFQFIGIAPDMPQWISEEDAAMGKDAILETAIEYLLR